MNTAVIYKSKYGATKKYAEWLANELNCPAFEGSKISPKELAQFDLIIYGGGLYAGRINGVSFVTKNQCKKLVVFTVGLNNPAATDYTEIINQNIPKELLSSAKTFHLHGGLGYKELSFLHKIGIKVLRAMLNKKPLAERSEDDKAILEAYGGKVDFTDKSSIKPIIEYVHSLEA